MTTTAFTQKNSANWRQTLRTNSHKTFGVILSFIFIYLLLGFIIDIYLNHGFEPNQFIPVVRALLTFQLTPVVTFVTGIVAIISLWITYALADKVMLLGTEYHEVTASSDNFEEKQLYNLVEEMKIAAGMRYMPKIYIIEANYLNAFASGYSEKSAMIAVTRGLIQKLERNELEAVIAHELSHIRHGDIRLTLTASVLSNLMLIILDIFFYSALFSSRDSRGGGNRFVIIIILLRYLLPIITILLMLYLSRTREYMADAGSVELMRDNEPLAKALLKISKDHNENFQACQKAYMTTAHEGVRRAAYLFDPFSNGVHPIKSLTTLFSTHPSIPDRLKAIGIKMQKKIED